MCKLNAEAGASCVWIFKSLQLFQDKKYKFTFFVAENWAPYCSECCLLQARKTVMVSTCMWVN